MTLTLAKEGKRKGILCNCLAPNAFTDMTDGLFPQELVSKVTVKEVSPIVMLMCHNSFDKTGKIYECGGGWFSESRF